MKTRVKIGVIGAGSFVFSTGLMYDLIAKHRLDGVELCLMDLDRGLVDIMAGIARRMATDSGVDIRVRSTTDRVEALDGANFVTTSVAAQLLKRYVMDREVLHKHGIIETNSECGGVGGLVYTLRQVPLILGIARDMEKLCPQAWLLNVSNPLPRVVTAITRQTPIRTLGFCNAAWGSATGYGNMAGVLGTAEQDLDVTSAGLNHFSWLLACRRRGSGEDLMPAVKAAVEAGKVTWGPLVVKLFRQYGYLALCDDSHTGEFIPFDAEVGKEHFSHHGTPQERAARRLELAEMAAGKRPWQDVHRAWEHPGDVVAAIVRDKSFHIDMVNLVNRGAIAGLADDAVVEVPADVRGGDVQACSIGQPPASLAGLWAQVSATHTLCAQAAVAGDRKLVHAVVDTDPAITAKDAAHAAVDELLQIHADMLPQFV